MGDYSELIARLEASCDVREAAKLRNEAAAALRDLVRERDSVLTSYLTAQKIANDLRARLEVAERDRLTVLGVNESLTADAIELQARLEAAERAVDQLVVLIRNVHGNLLDDRIDAAREPT